uniref:Uncharacterized protein n=1 Tax=Cyanothece sp. (strain PCC 7425 / ATCC 29141) TaxID=395961 RepID=B8HW90_CYAP4
MSGFALALPSRLLDNLIILYPLPNITTAFCSLACLPEGIVCPQNSDFQAFCSACQAFYMESYLRENLNPGLSRTLPCLKLTCRDGVLDRPNSHV